MPTEDRYALRHFAKQVEFKEPLAPDNAAGRRHTRGG